MCVFYFKYHDSLFFMASCEYSGFNNIPMSQAQLEDNVLYRLRERILELTSKRLRALQKGIDSDDSDNNTQ